MFACLKRAGFFPPGKLPRESILKLQMCKNKRLEVCNFKITCYNSTGRLPAVFARPSRIKSTPRMNKMFTPEHQMVTNISHPLCVFVQIWICFVIFLGLFKHLMCVRQKSGD